MKDLAKFLLITLGLSILLPSSFSLAHTIITNCPPVAPCGTAVCNISLYSFCDDCSGYSQEGFCSAGSYCNNGGCVACPSSNPDCDVLTPLNVPPFLQTDTADPVNIFSGEAYFSSTDFSLESRGPKLTLYRKFRSFSAMNGIFGYGWRTDLDVNLSRDSSGNVMVYDADGTQIYFTYSSGTYINSPGNFSTLVLNRDNTYTITDIHGISRHYDPTGRLNVMTDRNGNTLTFAYNPTMSGGTYIQDAGGRKITLNFDTNGHVISAVDPAGKMFQYSYDTNGDLASIQDPTGAVTNYTYDGNHRIIQMTNPNGHNRYYQYDTQGRCVLTSQDNHVNQTSLDYQSGNTTVVTDSLGHHDTYVFNSAGLLLSHADPLGNVTQQAWDQNMDKTSMTDALNHVTQFWYDSVGDLLYKVDPAGNQTEMTYSPDFSLITGLAVIAANGALHESVYTYDGKGNLITYQDAAGAQHYFVYDQYGEIITRTDSRGNSTHFTYDASGHILQKTDALGDATKFTYE